MKTNDMVQFYFKLFLFETFFSLFMFYGLKGGINENFYSIEMWGYFVFFWWLIMTVFIIIKVVQELKNK